MFFLLSLDGLKVIHILLGILYLQYFSFVFMASRYPSIKVVDYCYNPVHVVDSDKDIIVPCGKCDGCLLHKANEWSMRCGMEIEDTSYSIFGSLTYSNKYLPKLRPYVSQRFKSRNYFSWYSDNSQNIRFNSVLDVQRDDHIIIHRSYAPISVKNWDNLKYPVIPYASKRDIQLWLKLIRKDLYENGFDKYRYFKRGLFRYFIISEIGPTTLRPHFHFLIFCQSREVSEYLIARSLYQNWKMCDAYRFFPYVHYCDSGARGYVTQYLTCFSDLPNVFRENKEIRPFRLSSKSPAIGFVGFEKKEIFSSIDTGTIFYTRKVPRLESSSLLQYPKDLLSTIFPKCYQFNKMVDSRRFSIYNYLYREVRKLGFKSDVLCSRLSKTMHSQDFLATCACYRFCLDYIDSPSHYYYLLDTYYYLLDMQHLRSFYQSQQNCDFGQTPEKIFEYYPNIEVFCCDKDNFNRYRLKALISVLTPLGYNVDSLLFNEAFFSSIRRSINESRIDYFNEVNDITSNMVKMSKFNEMTGNSPSNV